MDRSQGSPDAASHEAGERGRRTDHISAKGRCGAHMAELTSQPWGKDDGGPPFLMVFNFQARSCRVGEDRVTGDVLYFHRDCHNALVLLRNCPSLFFVLPSCGRKYRGVNDA